MNCHLSEEAPCAFAATGSLASGLAVLLEAAVSAGVIPESLVLPETRGACKGAVSPSFRAAVEASPEDVVSAKTATVKHGITARSRVIDLAILIL